MGAGATGPGPKYDTRVPLGSTGPAFTVGRGGRGGGRAEPAPKPPSDEGAWGWMGGCCCRCCCICGCPCPALLLPLFLLRDPLYGTCQSLDPPCCTPTSSVSCTSLVPSRFAHRQSWHLRASGRPRGLAMAATWRSTSGTGSAWTACAAPEPTGREWPPRLRPLGRRPCHEP
jgi:hypothetical protein